MNLTNNGDPPPDTMNDAIVLIARPNQSGQQILDRRTQSALIEVFWKPKRGPLVAASSSLSRGYSGLISSLTF